MQYVKTTVGDLESSETTYKARTDQVNRQYRNLKELDQVIENLTANVQPASASEKRRPARASGR